MRRRFVVAASTLALLAAAATPVLASIQGASSGAVADLAGAARETEPLVLKGSAFGGWSAPAEVTAEAPHTDGVHCTDKENDCTHNTYEDPDVATGDSLGTGAAVDRLLGYRWNGKRFVQIPFQIDEMATRYLSNNASGFSFFSQTDQHPTYVFDEERFRWTQESPDDPCRAVPAGGVRSTPDPVSGLDDDDEVAFMASDAGERAPSDAPRPRGTDETREVRVTDPITGTDRFVYVALASEKKGAEADFDASNGYVRYQPDTDSDTFLYSQSAYDGYGNTLRGAWFDPKTGTCVTNRPLQHRPKDTAWIRTPTYAFRYEGRWLMTELRIAPPGVQNALDADPSTWVHGPDVIDQWKARAFQQRPGGETPCCGYEEEVSNWGGSTMLMGVRSGAVRTIRATWGADSSTNIVRTEIFYRDEIRQSFDLRVHVIPPGDGIYEQWDFNAAKIDTYFNPYVPEGVAVDGRNDEVFGNHKVRVARDGVWVQSDDPTPVVGDAFAEGVGAGGQGRCPDDACINNDIDTVDPTHSGVNGVLSYEQFTGPYGTLVDRYSVHRPTAGTAHAVVTTPYYRDDSCFDDGTGTDPGLHVKDRSVDDPIDSDGQERECWTPEMGDPLSMMPRDHLWQGSIGTAGVHFLFIADSDNAALTAPVDEISFTNRRVVLPGRLPNVGERYGRGVEKPLVATVAEESRPAPESPGRGRP